MSHEPSGRYCCDGQCEQGRRCPAIHSSIIAPTFAASSFPRRSWLREWMDRAGHRLHSVRAVMRRLL